MIRKIIIGVELVSYIYRCVSVLGYNFTKKNAAEIFDNIQFLSHEGSWHLHQVCIITVSACWWMNILFHCLICSNCKWMGFIEKEKKLKSSEGIIVAMPFRFYLFCTRWYYLPNVPRNSTIDMDPHFFIHFISHFVLHFSKSFTSLILA